MKTQYSYMSHINDNTNSITPTVFCAYTDKNNSNI